jgi:hypothetical protein
LATAQPSVAGENSEVKSADYVADPAAEKSAVIQVSYSTGTSGHKLTWRPYRPAPGKAGQSPRAERTASYNAADEPADVSALDDPFEDKTRVSQAAPPGNLRDDLLETPEPRPLPPLSLPQVADQNASPKAESSQRSAPIGSKELEQSLAAGPQAQAGRCRSPKEELEPISKISARITPEKGELPQECTLGDEQYQSRAWQPITFTWKASALCHKPLYFQEAQLERYGHTVGWGLQPIVSAGHFFVTVPVLPYAMGVTPPNECIYSLGYYRPGSCAPYILDGLPISVRAALFEAGAWVGAAAIFP